VKTHDRTSFFKYCTAKTAKTILSSKKFRWSSPLRFNDPFDHLYSIATEDSPSAHKQWFIDECDRVVFGEDEPAFPHPSPYSMMLLELRQGAVLPESGPLAPRELEPGQSSPNLVH